MFSNGSNGIEISGDRNLVEGNFVADESQLGNGGDGIVVRGTNNPLPPNVTVNNHIVGNIVLNNTGTGIFVSGHRNFIENNQAGEEGLGNGGSGIVVANSSTPPLPQGVTVNNTITDNNIFDNGRDGIGVSGDKNLIATNSVGDVRKGNGGNGIVVQGNLNVVNDHNTIFANGFTNGLPNGSSGIVVTGNENTLEINTIGDTNKGNGGDGIQVSGAKNLLKENKIFASTGDGIEVRGGTAGPTPSFPGGPTCWSRTRSATVARAAAATASSSTTTLAMARLTPWNWTATLSSPVARTVSIIPAPPAPPAMN